MNNFIYQLFALIIVGNALQRKYIFEKVKPEFLREPLFAEMYRRIKEMNDKEIDLNNVIWMAVSEKKIREAFRSFLLQQGVIASKISEDDLTDEITTFIAEKFTEETGDIRCIIKAIRSDYKKRAVNHIVKDCLEEGKPISDIKDRLNELEEMTRSDLWRECIVNPQAMYDSPEQPAMIMLDGEDALCKGDLYLVSGYAGTMKSLFCFTPCAAALNRGAHPEKTLNFSSIDAPLRVLYCDTELSKNTIKKRLKILKRMCGEIDDERFMYLNLTSILGDKQAKMDAFLNACHSFLPDLIVIDSFRDLCYDLNDYREADNLVCRLKQLAAELNAVILVTSHKSIVNSNAKGHLGVRLNEAASIEFSLEREKGSDYIQVTFTKQRDSFFKPFAFGFDEESGILKPLVMQDEVFESKRVITAKSALSAVIRPGEYLKYNQLKRSLIEGPDRLTEATAKNYIKLLTGTMLFKSQDGSYFVKNDLPPDNI